MIRTAFYGGAFDPPHLAHVFTVAYLLGRDDVDEVWVAPTASHVFNKRMSAFADRVRMLELALAPFGGRASISQVETERDGPSRTFDTLDLLSQRHPDRAFTLVVGADNLTESHRWHRWDDLVARWPIIALGRPGHEAALRRFAAEAWCSAGPTLAQISSTQVRAALRGRGDPAALAWVPDAVLPLATALFPREPLSLPAITIFGAGRAGMAWAHALRRAGAAVTVWNRSARAGADVTGALPVSCGPVWLLAVSDPAIEGLAERLADRKARVALHCAGRLGVEPLAALQAAGVAVGSVHPLQSLRGDGGAELVGAFTAIEGDAAAVDLATQMAEAVGARPVTLPVGDKAAYHAAAVYSANFTTTLLAGGVDLLVALGLDEPTARGMLLPLLQGTVENLRAAPARDALTGPFARRDGDAVLAHLDAIARRAPHLREVYLALARRSAAWLGWSLDLG